MIRRKKWSKEEQEWLYFNIELDSELSDRELAKELRRSINSIESRKRDIKNGRYKPTIREGTYFCHDFDVYKHINKRIPFISDKIKRNQIVDQPVSDVVIKYHADKGCSAERNLGDTDINESLAITFLSIFLLAVMLIIILYITA